ncbi:MAG: TIGR00374 family protein, partial [Actinomycetota bacterium]|nr:TIGR00374 family protein [Actinomycetota bacterium]
MRSFLPEAGVEVGAKDADPGKHARVATAGERKPTAEVLSRHPADLFRLIAGLVVFGLLALAARRADPGTIQLAIAELVDRLPDVATVPLFVLMQAGAGGAVAVAAAASLLTRRYRLAVALLLGGALASLSTLVFKVLVGGRQAGRLLSELLLSGRVAGEAGFPSGHVATAAALATVAAPYLSRPLRRLSWLGVGLVAVARMDVGGHLPLEV